MTTNEELFQYIKLQRKRGTPDEKITEKLANIGGWSKEDIQHAFDEIDNIEAAQPHSGQGNASTASRTPEPEDSTPSRKPRRWSVFVVVIALLVVVVGVAAAYTMTKLDERTTTDEEVVTAALTNISEVSSYAYDAKVQVEVEEGVNNSSLTMTATGEAATNNAPEGTRSSTDMTFQGSTHQDGMNVSINAALKVRVVDDTIYLFFENIARYIKPYFPIPERQWISIDVEEVASTQANLELDDADREAYSEFIKEALAAAKDTNFYTIALVETTKVDGQSVHVYNITLQPEHLKAFSAKLSEMADQRQDLPEDARMRVKAMNELVKHIDQDGIDDMQAVFESLSFRLMISKDDLMLRQFRLTIAELPSEFIGPDLRFAADAEINFSDFNQPITVEVPADARSLEEIIASSSMPFVNPFLHQASRQQSSSIVKSSLASFRAGAELTVRPDGTYPADLFTNIEHRVAQIIDLVEKETSNQATYGVSADGHAYGVEIQLSDGRYYCVDSTGFFGEVDSSTLEPESGDVACR